MTYDFFVILFNPFNSYLLTREPGSRHQELIMQEVYECPSFVSLSIFLILGAKYQLKRVYDLNKSENKNRY